ncbi:MAG: AAA family ATPase [Candidatus Binatia bacterium]
MATTEEKAATAAREALEEAVPVERKGMGYCAETTIGPVLRFDHIHERGGELHGELHVSTADKPNLLWGSFNLSSMTVRNTTVKFLSEQVPPLDWRDLLNRFCVGALRLHREGQTRDHIGGSERVLEMPRMLWAPLIAADQPTIVFAPGGTGKSLLAVAATVAVETGAQTVPGTHATDPAKVLVLDWEDDARTWDFQLRAVCAGAGVPVPVVQYQCMRTALADRVEEIAAAIAEENIGLVIVDSVEAACGSGREHEGWNERAQRLMDAVRNLGVAALLLDHVAGTDIGQNTPSNKMIGAVAKINRARYVFELRAEKEPTNDRIELVLRDTKRNGRGGVPTMSFAACFSDFDSRGAARNIRYERCEVQAPELVSRLSLADQISRVLRNGAMRAPAVAAELDVKPMSVRMTLNRYKDKRFVKLPGGEWGLSRYE